MTYHRPLLASLLYFIGLLGVVGCAIVAFAAIRFAEGSSQERGLFLALAAKDMVGPFLVSVLILAAGSALEWLSKINHNVAMLVMDAEARSARESTAAGSEARRNAVIPGIND